MKGPAFDGPENQSFPLAVFPLLGSLLGKWHKHWTDLGWAGCAQMGGLFELAIGFGRTVSGRGDWILRLLLLTAVNPGC